jgi:hypothetical protein
MMKCNDCGATGINAIGCPDCGSDNLVPEAGGQPINNQPVLAAPAPQATVAAALPVMPSVMINTSQATPVLAKVIFSATQTFDLREGDTFTVASDRATEDVNLKLDDEQHPGVSSAAFKLIVRGGKVFATGGGGNGFWIITETTIKPNNRRVERNIIEDRYNADEEQEVVLGQGIKLGKNTRFKIK